ncbi:VOC family protein [Cellulomonas sp. ICMP 17802]|uniref:VOC family protein n=1 Tax=Cellulomonas sp. ICMP 17802 TaxID=3239199 RepID=UPI00351B037D
MTMPVTYVEISSPDLAVSTAFFADTFGWALQPFADPGYLVAPHGDGPGVDAALLASRDGTPRTVPVIRVDSLDEVCGRVEAHGGQVVVPPFTIAGVGRGCYVTDPAGVLVGLHEYDPAA